jgi:hypothetical protein
MPSRKKGRGFQPSVGGGGGWPFGGRQPPSGPRGFGGGPLLPLGEVDLEKVKREVAEAREQVEDAVKAQQARDLLAYMARRPMHVSESAWFAVKGDWVPAEGLKRRLDEVEDKERKLKVKEISADLQKQAAEEEKKEGQGEGGDAVQGDCALFEGAAVAGGGFVGGGEGHEEVKRGGQ